MDEIGDQKCELEKRDPVWGATHEAGCSNVTVALMVYQ